ncbi:MAG: hypothetical protein QM760_08125 [Nibricoccus sp.]
MKTTSRVSRMVVALGLAFAPVVHASAASGKSISSTANASSAMSDAPSGYSYKILAPTGREFLKCRFLLPDDFKLTDLPEGETDFSENKNFMPLAIAAANYGSAIFIIGSRPAYKEGNVADWLPRLLREDGADPGAVELVNVGPLKAVACDAMQVANGVVMRMRVTMLEDGGRLYNFIAVAPNQLWVAVAGKFNDMLKSFEVETLGGPTMPIDAAAEAAVKQQTEEAAESQKTEQTARLSSKEFAELVLADDMSALDPDQKINANLRDRGIGFVPNVLSVDRNEKSVRVGAGAIEGIFRVPFGWHVNDDGRRTLVFDGAGRMQISLNLRRREHDSLAELGQSYIAEYVENQPGLKSFTHELDGIVAVGVRGLKVDNEVLDQTFLLRDIGRDGYVLVARATGNAEDIRLAMNLAGDILSTVEAEMAALK